jgi:AbrB family looped-hinge helix DNA binding protein
MSVLERRTPARSTKVGRNAPCPCGSGRKYKHCCGAQLRARPERARLPCRSRQGISGIGSGSSIAEFLHCCQTAKMKTTLTVTSRGVITLPAKLRQALGLKADDQLIAETTPEGLLLRPAVTLPIEMYSDKRVREFDEAEAELEQVLPRKKKPAR